MPSSFEEFFSRLPRDTQDLLKSIWGSLPPAEKSDLQALYKILPFETRLMKLLLNLSVEQLKLAFGKKQRVAIVGPANVGKSTLYNNFIRTKKDQAAVSPLPGTTRARQEADAGLFSIIDTPGADAVGEVGEHEKDLALSAARESDFLIIMFDAIQGVKRTEHELYQELTALGKPYIVVLNKIDLVKRDTIKVVEKVAIDLQLQPEQVYAIAAKDGKNLEQVLLAIAAAEPEIVAALGRALPEYRLQLARRAIISASSVAAVVALAPLPLIDFVPLVITQSTMVLTIARIYNYRITFERARELVATFGLGFLARTIFQEMSKLGGIPGWLLSTAIASSTTAAMGYAAVVWFDKGSQVTTESLNRFTRQLTRYLLDRLSRLFKRKPGGKNLQQFMSEALEGAPLMNDGQIDVDQITTTEGNKQK